MRDVWPFVEACSEMLWKQAKWGFAPSMRRTACHLGFRLHFPASVDFVGQPKYLLPFWDGSEKALIALELVSMRSLT